jgi:hypothetical protein
MTGLPVALGAYTGFALATRLSLASSSARANYFSRAAVRRVGSTVAMSASRPLYLKQRRKCRSSSFQLRAIRLGYAPLGWATSSVPNASPPSNAPSRPRRHIRKFDAEVLKFCPVRVSVFSAERHSLCRGSHTHSRHACRSPNVNCLHEGNHSAPSAGFSHFATSAAVQRCHFDQLQFKISQLSTWAPPPSQRSET